MANTVRIRHFILGLLTRQPMSGYDIKRFLKSLSWLIDSPSYGSLYPALHTLLEDGLVTVEVIPREDKPPRKIYSITEPGRQELQEWMDQPITPGASLKAFVMRLVLASNLSTAGLLTYLQQRRAQVSAHQKELVQIAAGMDEQTDLGERLALDYGLALANAELAWLDQTLTGLSHRPHLAGIAQSEVAAPTV
jgi:DNA-binding PadR family transcriptional regulator